MAVAIAFALVATLGASDALARGDGDGHDMDMGDHGHSTGHSGGRRHRNAPTVAGARKVAVLARSFRYSPRRLTVAAGEDVTIVLTSRDALHDLVVKGEGHVVAARAGTTRRGGLVIDEPGRYAFYCSVPGHRAAGMKGTITVE